MARKGKRNGSAGIQSVEVCAPLLKTLAAATGPLTLTSLASAAKMTPSKAHKYLASLIRTGLVSQIGPTGRYSLGGFATELGFAALRRIDVVDISRETLEQLRDELDLTTVLTIWGNFGPTLVRKVQGRQPVSLFVQLGMVMPLLTSSTGRVFAAYLDRGITKPFIDRELAPGRGAAAKAGLTRAGVEAILSEVKKDGFAVIAGTVHSGIAGVSAPIFDDNEIVGVLNLVGIQGVLDISKKGKPAKTLLAAAESLSRQLGKPLPHFDVQPPAAGASRPRRNPAPVRKPRAGSGAVRGA